MESRVRIRKWVVSAPEKRSHDARVTVGDCGVTVQLVTVTLKIGIFRPCCDCSDVGDGCSPYFLLAPPVLSFRQSPLSPPLVRFALVSTVTTVTQSRRGCNMSILDVTVREGTVTTVTPTVTPKLEWPSEMCTREILRCIN